MARERVAHIDMAAGIMILWMMLGHINAKQIFLSTPDIYVFLSNFFFFFMPWFFYKSGMFFVPQEGRIMGGGEIAKAIRNMVYDRLYYIHFCSNIIEDFIFISFIAYSAIKICSVPKSCALQQAVVVSINFVCSYECL